MKALKQMRMAAAVAMGTLLAAQTMGQTVQHVEAKQQTAAAPAHKRVIVVSLEDRELALVEDGQVKKIYVVAVGKASTPSPEGTFTIERRVMNPTYSHDGRVVAPGPDNPVGTRWMGLNIRGYGIHGTNAPGSIGKAASHGCIRMGKGDLEELYAMVEVGDTVELVGRRSEQTAQLFGGAVIPVNAQAPKTEVATATHMTQTAAPVAHETVAASTAPVTGAL